MSLRFQTPPTRALLPAWMLLLCLPLVATRAGASPGDLIREVQSLLGSDRASGLRFSLEFVPLETEPRKPSVSVAAETPLVPASITKLVTSLAALETLGSDHTFSTHLYRTGPSEDGVLRGDLELAGEGDPFLVTERLWLLAHRLRSEGLKRIEGDLVIHASGFPLDDPTAEASLGDSDRSYAARPSGVAMNFNCVALRVSAGARPGGPTRIAGDPYDLGYLELDDALRTGPPGGRLDWYVELEPTAHGLRYEDWARSVEAMAGDSLSGVPGSFVLPEGALEVARIRGTLPAGVGERLVYRRARYPLPFVGSLFAACLAEFEIELGGRIRIEVGPPGTEPWISFPSLPLDELLVSMNRYSSNFIANQIALAVHRERSVARSAPEFARDGSTTLPPSSGEGSAGSTGIDPLAPGSAWAAGTTLRMEDAGASLTAWLRDVTPRASGCRLHDGSGLALENRLTAGAVTDLLIRTWDEFRYQPKLLFGLPGPGQPGTLRSRFQEGGTAPALWAKTGTLSDSRVSSLAGYLEDSSGRIVAFTMILNADPGSRWNVDSMQEMQEHWIREYLR